MKEIRVHGTASDGQLVHMYFAPYKVDKRIVWGIGLIIGVGYRQANDWYRKYRSSKYRGITGRGGIAPLAYALNILLHFAAHLPSNAVIQISPADKRRASAYRYLIRLKGWREGNDGYIYYENPKEAE